MARQTLHVEKIGRVTSVSVEKCTGKNWDTWIRILNKAGAKSMPHVEITKLLKKKFKLSVWWQQGVATGFEIHIGRKVEGRDAKGLYSVTATRTFPLEAKALWNYLVSPAGMQEWLRPLAQFQLKPGASFECEGEIFGEVRTLKSGVRARLRWQETEWIKPSVLNLHIVARKGGKSILIFNHVGLRDARLRTQMRERWQRVLQHLLTLNVT